MASLVKRGSTYYLQWFVHGTPKRRSLRTASLQIAKEKLRQFESAQLRGDDNPLPTRTLIADVVTAYVDHIRLTKTPKSAQTDVYYLRQAFGPICDALRITSRKVTEKCRKRPRIADDGRRPTDAAIEATYFEAVTTADVATFIANMVRGRGLAPKTANRYREILCRLFNWSMQQGGIRMPADRNPVARVERYKERAAEIRFLTLRQIDEQFAALADHPQLQTMVAVYIYAGLRREEALWLQLDDIDLTAGRFGMIRVRAKTVDGESWQPKTKVNRAVPISSALRAYLDRYALRPSFGNWYFPSPKACHYDPDHFSQALRRSNRTAGLPWGCLDFRHTFGSHLAMKGESLYKISTLMGNSPDICRRHYAALMPAEMVDSVEFNSTASVSGVRLANRFDGEPKVQTQQVI